MRLLAQSTLFVAGFVSNLICQALRCAANLAGFALLSLLGTVGTLVGVLRIVGGGSEKGSELCRSSWSKIRKAAVMLASSALQFIGVATLATPFLRAAQASSEPLAFNGVYAPSSPNRGRWQGLFGLNSWEPPEPAPSRPKKVAMAVAKPKTKGALPKPEQAGTKRPRPNPHEEEWTLLAEMYLRCRTREEADRIRLKMATGHPRRYIAALRAAERRGNLRATA